MANNEIIIYGFLPAIEQLSFLKYELSRLTGGKPARWLILFFEPSTGVLISYRLDRCFHLLFGPAWTPLRVLAFPLFLLLRVLSCRHEICFKAKIGKGLWIVHPTLGVVVHGDAIIGGNLILTGGNSIGCRRGICRGELILGDDVTLGINSCILGPAHIGNRVTIGAGAVCVENLPDDCIAVGVPAKPRSQGAQK